MTVTALTLSPVDVAAVSLPTAAAIATGAGTPTYTAVKTTVGLASGFGEVTGLGNLAYVWPQLNTMPTPTGYGWLLDENALQGQQLIGGTWSGTIQLAVSTGYLVADVWARFSWWNTVTGLYETFGVLLAAGQTINTLYGSGFSISGGVPQQLGVTGARLYHDLWLNITQNGTGSGSAYVEIRVPTGFAQGNAYTTQGYQPLPLYPASIAYSFGDFCFNDGANYLLVEKSLDIVSIKETLFKVARFEGMKMTGAVTNERTIPLRIGVLGASRADLELKLDTLAAAFSNTQQPLTLHSVDGRYFIADCVSLTAPLPPGSILYTVAQASMLCQQPYAFAANPSSYTLANLLLAAGAAGTWVTGTQLITGGGTVFSRPTLTVQNETLANATTLTGALTNGSPYTSIGVAALPNAVAIGDSFTLTSSSHSQTVVASATASAGATSITVTSFNANFSYPATTTTVVKVITITNVTITQATDGQTISVGSITLYHGDTLTIVCDPTVANGYTCSVNGGAPLAFTGVFPVQEPGATQWLVTVSCASPVTANVGWGWTPRFLS